MLVSYPRPFPKDYERDDDLTKKHTVANELIRVLELVFRFRSGLTRFHGYAYENRSDLLFINVFQQGKMVYQVILAKTGYTGIVNADVLSRDFVGAMSLEPFKEMDLSKTGVQPSIVDVKDRTPDTRRYRIS